jgi:hypothetical protein
MYRQQEDTCSECLELLSDFLSRAQAYVAHLGTFRPTNQFKKDDDLHESLRPLSAAQSVRTVPAQVFTTSIPVATAKDPPFSSLPSVYEAHSHISGMIHAPVHLDSRQQYGGARDFVPAAQTALAQEYVNNLLWLHVDGLQCYQ